MMPLQDSIPAPHTQLVINSTELHFLMCTKQRTRHIVSPKCKVTVHTDMSTSFTKGNFDVKTKRYVFKRLSPSHLDIHHESALQFVLSMDGMNNDFTRFLYWTEFMTLKCVSKDVKLQLSRIEPPVKVKYETKIEEVEVFALPEALWPQQVPVSALQEEEVPINIPSDTAGLKMELKRFGLKQWGTKAVLRKRLRQKIRLTTLRKHKTVL